MFSVWQRLHPVIALMASANGSKGGSWQIIHKLSEQGLVDLYDGYSKNYVGGYHKTMVLACKSTKSQHAKK